MEKKEWYTSKGIGIDFHGGEASVFFVHSC